MPRTPLVKRPLKIESTPGTDTGEQLLHRLIPDTYRGPGPDADYEQFRQRIIIKKEALDIAVEEQAEVFLEICERHATALSIFDDLKDQLRREDANYARELRAGKDRMTDAAVASELLINPAHIDLAQRMATQKKRVDDWANLREAFEHRRGMLRLEVDLYVSGYFGAAGAVGPRNAVRDALAATAKEALARNRRDRNARE